MHHGGPLADAEPLRPPPALLDLERTVTDQTLVAFGGMYAGIGNPLTHEQSEELEEHEALEQLGAFSVLARWVDGAVVERAS